jgi:hypothetical protein
MLVVLVVQRCIVKTVTCCGACMPGPQASSSYSRVDVEWQCGARAAGGRRGVGIAGAVAILAGQIWRSTFIITCSCPGHPAGGSKSSWWFKHASYGIMPHYTSSVEHRKFCSGAVV